MVDIRIIAHPKRSDNVYKILSDLQMSDDIVVWDDRPCGGDAMYTARKAWTLPIPEGCTHRLVIQDDAKLCNGFLTILKKVAEKHPNDMITFFHEDVIETDERYRPFLLTVGVAIMMPVDRIDQFFRFVDNDLPIFCGNLTNKRLKEDTGCMRMWILNNYIRCITTIPSLVQHIGDESLLGTELVRRAADFMENPPLEGW